MTASDPLPSASPRWSSTAKLIVGLSFVALIFGLLAYFREFIGPLILAFMVTYLLHPVANGINRLIHSWRISVTLLYLGLLILLSGAFTWAGVISIQQIQSLVGVVEGFILNLPQLARDLSNQVYTFGPFQFTPSQYLDLNYLSEQLLALVQPALSQVTTLVGSLATGALAIIGYGAFVLLASYFLLADAGNVSGLWDFIHIPGYDVDIRRLGRKLERLWNSFLRGQLMIFVMVVIAYTILMMILGVRLAIGIALLAGLARFLPYIGPAVVWIVIVLATFFQPHNYLGMQPLSYTVLVIILAVVLDQIFDNLVSPQIMGQTLRVNPVAVLIGAIVAAKFIGIVGIILAAPVVASLKLFSTYAFRKMLDLPPWPEEDTRPIGEVTAGIKLLYRLRLWLRLRK